RRAVHRQRGRVVAATGVGDGEHVGAGLRRGEGPGVAAAERRRRVRRGQVRGRNGGQGGVGREGPPGPAGGGPAPRRRGAPGRGWGVRLNGAVTNALPPPVSLVAAEAAGPITATVPPWLADSGRVPLFFSSTVPSSATWVATAWCALLVTLSWVLPVGGLLNKWNRNISVRIRAHMPSTTDLAMWPCRTAFSRAVP